MAKQILFSEDARKAIAKGIAQAAHAVKVTLGPAAGMWLSRNPYDEPRIKNDGVSIAKEISLEDKFENMGAEIVRKSRTKRTTMLATVPQPPSFSSRRLSSKGFHE